jgi:branched-chain amino acid transport system substrate-binding protein
MILTPFTQTSLEPELIAEQLGQSSQVLGVVGHYASEVTKEVLSLYKKSRLPLVSGTSTSTGLSISKLVQDNYFFRTVSTTQQAAQKLANYTVYEAKQKKAFALYDFDQNQEFSHTIGNSFKQSFTDLVGTIVKEFDLSKSLNYTSILKEAQQSGAVLALFPSGHTNARSFRNMLQLVEYNAANGGNLWIVGGNPLYNSELLRSLEKISQNQTVRLDRLVVVVDWHYAKSPNQEFVQEARVFWKGDVGWRTATTYDAAKVFIAAIEKSLLNNSTPSRQGIRDIIAARDFLTTGATGKIQFDGSDRPNARTYLLKVSKSCKGKGYMFVPIDAPASCSSSPYGNIDSMP